jgi:hypothetical protein
LGWGIVRILGNVNYASIAPIPTFPRCRGKEQIGEGFNVSVQLDINALSVLNEAL